MGDVTDETDETARFNLRELGLTGKYVLVFMRCHFSGTGSGTADMLLKLDSVHESFYDVTLFTWQAVGASTDVFFRVGQDQAAHWVFQDGDELVFEWTNPDSGNIQYGIELGLALVQ